MKTFSSYFDLSDIKFINAVLHIEDDDIESFGEVLRCNISSVLKCKPEAPDNFSILKGGLSNLSMRFSVADDYYVYRQPGHGTEQYVNRESEACANAIGRELGIDDSFIYIEPKQGWKISRYIPNARALEYRNPSDVEHALRIMRTLHNSGKKTTKDFLLWEETVKVFESVLSYGKEHYSDYESLFAEMSALAAYAKDDGIPLALCHGDCWKPNFLITKDQSGDDIVNIIDWEFSGNCDPGFDLGTFICCSDYTFEESLPLIRQYYGEALTDVNLRHMLALTSMSSYYWFVYGVYLLERGSDADEFVDLWYKNSVVFLKGALPYYKK